MNEGKLIFIIILPIMDFSFYFRPVITLPLREERIGIGKDFVDFRQIRLSAKGKKARYMAAPPMTK